MEYVCDIVHVAGKSDEFKKILGGAIDSKGIPYDINSLMHFGPHAFAKAEGYNTLETLTGKTDFGQRNGLSTLDIEQAKLLYCTDGCQHVDKVPECQYYKSQGYCNQGSGYESYMETQCKRSCLCNVCEDTDANCSEFVRQGFCTNPEYSVHMNAYCKKSCNLCT
ncbi:predicted protein [Nematostella vectensis]|uniref:Metalloendopeptidase n=1 Tax=Nematostella vectensis TaxID=45351 RepID=A7T7G9_NEMVE|nr:predicted protein [Nematostella vectensis]|eukprot:XP_001620182.1 hypothetical protein NEMVEDRAFT_v1g223363 [Nematostella vectensis]